MPGVVYRFDSVATDSKKLTGNCPKKRKEKKGLLMYRSMHVCLALVVEDVTALQHGWNARCPFQRKGVVACASQVSTKKGISSFQK